MCALTCAHSPRVPCPLGGGWGSLTPAPTPVGLPSHAVPMGTSQGSRMLGSPGAPQGTGDAELR